MSNNIFLKYHTFIIIIFLLSVKKRQKAIDLPQANFLSMSTLFPPDEVTVRFNVRESVGVLVLLRGLPLHQTPVDGLLYLAKGAFTSNMSNNLSA